MMTTQLDKVAVLLDPDEEKASRHADYLLEKGAARRAEEERLKRERAMQEAEEQRRKEAEEQRRKAEEEREREVKKLEKLAKSEASLKCPYCNRAIRVKDLRPGMKHRCVFCNEVFQME
jgi:colicin import membrane protein